MYPGGEPTSRDTECFSMYSDMSTWIIASSSPKRNSASVRASSVLPTPEGPSKMKEPAGRFGSLIPARARRIDFETATIASCWPMTRLCSSSSIRMSFCDSASVSLKTGMPVHIETMSAISSSPISGCSAVSSWRQLSSSSRFFCDSLRSLSRSEAAFSNSCASIAASLSLRTLSISSSSSRERGVPLEVLAVLVERRRADRLQLPARQRRLQDRGCVDRALGGACADEVVELVDEQDDVAALGDLLHHLLQALLELTAVLRPGDERREVEGVDLLALEELGHLVPGDSGREALDDGRLADAGLA